MVGVIWYRFVRYSGTDWSATLVPIGAMRWYRFIRYSGTDSPILSPCFKASSRTWAMCSSVM